MKRLFALIVLFAFIGIFNCTAEEIAIDEDNLQITYVRIETREELDKKLIHETERRDYHQDNIDDIDRQLALLDVERK